MRIPKYCRHKSSGQAIVWLGRKCYYLGAYGSAVSKKAYEARIREWLEQDRSHVDMSDITIAQVGARYWAEQKRRHGYASGREAGSVETMHQTVRRLSLWAEDMRAVEFGPKALDEFRQGLIEEGLSRGYVNKLVNQVKHLFKWAVTAELIPVTVYQALALLPGLRQDEYGVRETPPVTAVPDEVVDATLPHLLPQVRDMVTLQRRSGMRPGEVCTIKPGLVEQRPDGIWIYRPASHKTKYKGKVRLIVLGPLAQKVLRPYLNRDPDAFCFSPGEAMAQRRAALRKKRKTPVQPSQQARDEQRSREYNNPYWRTPAYAYAIRRACQKAGIELWSPNQLRHAAATEIRKKYSLADAKAALGHSSISTTLIYAESCAEEAAKVMREIG